MNGAELRMHSTDYPLNNLYQNIKETIQKELEIKCKTQKDLDKNLSNIIFNFSLEYLKRIRMGHEVNQELTKRLLLDSLIKQRIFEKCSWVDVDKLSNMIHFILQKNTQNLRETLSYAALKSKNPTIKI
jgi:hypothetical protein